MNNLFQMANDNWVKYSEYIFKEGKDGVLYITPAPKAKPMFCDLLENAETLVLDALNVGMLQMGRSKEEKVRKGAIAFKAISTDGQGI